MKRFREFLIESEPIFEEEFLDLIEITEPTIERGTVGGSTAKHYVYQHNGKTLRVSFSKQYKHGVADIMMRQR